MFRRVAVVFLALSSIGCAEPSPSAEATPGASSPTADFREAERSNAFWEANSDFAPTNFRYASLAEMTGGSHLIVLGRVVGTEERELQPFEAGGPAPGGRRVIFGIVTIDEVLKGEAIARMPDAILVARLGATEQRAEDIPSGQVVLFLMHYPRMRAEAGVGLSADPNDRFYYARPNGYQCALRNLGGAVRIVDGPEGWEEALGPFPAPLDGEPFEDLLAAIRQTVGST